MDTYVNKTRDKNNFFCIVDSAIEGASVEDGWEVVGGGGSLAFL